LVVSQIFWAQEADKGFAEMQEGNKEVMKDYDKFQIQQPTRLIEVTRTDLTADRQKVARFHPSSF